MRQAFFTLLFLSSLFFSFLALAQPPASDIPQKFPHEIALLKYPFPTCHSATVGSILKRPTHLKLKTFFLRVRPERQNVQYFENRDQQEIGYALQNRPSRLVILVPGLGATSTSPLTQLLAESLYDQGMSILTLPSRFTWHFSLGVSRSGMPGYTPEDAQDLAVLAQMALRQLQGDQRASITGYDLMGYSLGGLDAIFLAPLLEKNLPEPLGHIVLINPPVDLQAGAQALDQLYALGDKIGEARQDQIMGTLIHAFSESAGRPIRLEDFERVQKSLKLNDNDFGWLIGNSFREDLSSVVYMSQQVHDRGLLKTPQKKLERNMRLIEAKHVSFMHYIQSFLTPMIAEERRAPQEAATLVMQASLMGQTQRLKEDSRIKVFHTQDDFLMTERGADWLRSTFEDRLILFDRGGHMGEVWAPEFYRELIRAFRD